MKNLRLYFLIIPLVLSGCKVNDFDGSNSKLKGSWVKKELHTNLPFLSNTYMIDTLIFNDFFNRKNIFLLNKNAPYLGSYKIVSKNKLWVKFIDGRKNVSSGFYLKYAFKDDNNLIVQYNVNTFKGKFYVQSTFQKVE